MLFNTIASIVLVGPSFSDCDPIHNFLVCDILFFDLIYFLFLRVRPQLPEVKFVDRRKHKGWQKVAILPMRSIDFRIKPIGDLNDGEHNNFRLALGVFIQGLIQPFPEILKAIVRLSFFFGNMNFTGEHILKGVNRFVSSGGTVPSDLFQVTKVKFRDRVHLKKGLFDLLLYTPNIGIFLRPLEISAIIPNNHGNSALGWQLLIFIILFVIRLNL